MVKQMVDASIFYDPAETLSHNAILNMVLSHRGGGKTFGCLELCVRGWINNKKRFIYLRRTEAELKLCKDQLMEAINNVGYHPGYKFYVNGFEVCVEYNGEKSIIGWCIALSKAYQMKSVAYPDVKYIVFDEFILEDRNGRYLPNEPKKLLSFMETVGRLRDLRVLMLGNYASRANPYFEYFKVYPRIGSKFTKGKDNLVLIHMYKNTAFSEVKADTDFARLIAGTSYGDFILNNDNVSDNFSFVQTMSGFMRYVITLRFEGRELAVWYVESEGLFYISSKSDPSCKTVMALDTDSHEPNFILIKQNKQHPNIRQLKYALENGLIRFENISIKNIFLTLFGLV